MSTDYSYKSLFKSNSSLPVVDDKCSSTRARNALASLITSIDSLEQPLFCYKLSKNDIGSFCELLRLEDCGSLSILKICGLIRQKKVNEKMILSIVMDQWISFISHYELSQVEISKSKDSVVTNNKRPRRDMTFIRIGTKSTYSYIKATTQYNHHILPPIIKMHQLSHYFLKSISIEILEIIHWSEN